MLNVPPSQVLHINVVLPQTCDRINRVQTNVEIAFNNVIKLNMYGTGWRIINVMIYLMNNIFLSDFI